VPCPDRAVVSSRSEFDLISCYFQRPAAVGMLGVGDDCALFTPPVGMQLAVSKDLLLEGRHFFSDVSPESLGHKALAVNLSDLAAMGAQPVACLLGLALPVWRAADPDWLQAFAQGFLALADAHLCPLLGGDTTRSDTGIAISVTVFGTVPIGQALRRDAARIGDDIWISGHAWGAADAALAILQGHYADDGRLMALRPALERPEPQLALGLALRGIAHACIDVSDGLLQDLGHILSASACGARLYEADLPVAPALAGWPAERLRASVLGGGDVYQLCFTAPAAAYERVRKAGEQAGVAVTRIGVVTDEPGLTVLDAQGQVLPHLPRGFDHFG